MYKYTKNIYEIKKHWYSKIYKYGQIVPTKNGFTLNIIKILTVKLLKFGLNIQKINTPSHLGMPQQITNYLKQNATIKMLLILQHNTDICHVPDKPATERNPSQAAAISRQFHER